MAILGPLYIPCIIVFLIGLTMFVIEMFTPGFGIAGFLGILCMAAVIVMQFTTNTVEAALIVTAIILLLGILLLIWFLFSFRRGSLSRSRLVLKDEIDQSSSPVTEKDAELKGKTGVAITMLRPAGIAEIDGKRINVQTYGNFIEKGSAVTVTAVEGLNVFVQ